jgi:hypothetical protein
LTAATHVGIGPGPRSISQTFLIIFGVLSGYSLLVSEAARKQQRNQHDRFSHHIPQRLRLVPREASEVNSFCRFAIPLPSAYLRLVSWSLKFDDPIATPAGKPLRTLRDAGRYVTSLPEAETALSHWQTAVQCLLTAAEHGGPVMMARIAMMHALKLSLPRASS